MPLPLVLLLLAETPPPRGSQAPLGLIDVGAAMVGLFAATIACAVPGLFSEMCFQLARGLALAGASCMLLVCRDAVDVYRKRRSAAATREALEVLGYAVQTRVRVVADRVLSIATERWRVFSGRVQLGKGGAGKADKGEAKDFSKDKAKDESSEDTASTAVDNSPRTSLMSTSRTLLTWPSPLISARWCPAKHRRNGERRASTSPPSS